MISRTDIEDMTDAQDELADAIGMILSITPEGDPWRASSFGTYPLDCTPTDEAIATILNAVVSGDLARPSQAGDERVARLIRAVECELNHKSAYDATPQDRGGHKGPKGQAYQLWMDARAELAAALAAMDTPKGGGDE